MAITGNFLSTVTESIDPNTSGWVAKLNCAISLGSGGLNGDGTLKLTSSASGEMQARTVSSYAVTPFTQYEAFADASGVTVPERIGIRWLNAVNAEISISWGLTTTTASATWHRIGVGDVAPGGAVRAQVVVSATPAAGAVINYFENVYLGYPITTTGNLFGFKTEKSEIDATGWTVELNCAITRQAPMVGWSPTYYLAGGNVIAATVTAGGNAAIRTTDHPPVVAGTEYLGYCYLNPPLISSVTWVELRFYDGSGTQIQATRSTLAAPGTGWVRQYASATAPAGAVTCSLAAGIDSATAAQVLRVDGAVITVMKPLTVGTVVPYADASFEQGVAGWSVISGAATITRSTPWGTFPFEGNYSGTITSATATSSVVRSAKFPLPAGAAGLNWRTRVLAQVTAGSWNLSRGIRWYSATNTDLGLTAGTLIAAPTPGWWSLSDDFIAPAGATQAAIEYSATATAVSSVLRIDMVGLWQALPDSEVAAHADTASITLTLRELVTGYLITVYRVAVDGSRTLVRGSDGLLNLAPITSTQMVFEDYEAPLGVPVSYYVETRATAVAVAGYRTTNAVTVALGDGDYVWLKDPGEPQRNMRVLVEAPPTWTRPIEQAVSRVKGRRNAVVFSGERAGYEGDLQIMTASDEERADLHYLLDSGHVLLWQSNPGYGVDDTYVSVGAVPEARAGGDATDPWRVWTLPMTQVDMPITVGVAGSAGRTWQDILTENATWGAVLSRYATWEDVLFDRRIGG